MDIATKEQNITCGVSCCVLGHWCHHSYAMGEAGEAMSRDASLIHAPRRPGGRSDSGDSVKVGMQGGWM